MNRTITVNVVKEFARQDSQNGGIQGSGNVDHLRLRFSEDWDGYAKTCVFWDANGENPVKVIVGADKLEDVTKDPRTYIIDIPPEPLAVEGTYTVVIDGYLDGKRGRSETIRLKSNGAQIADDAGEPADPTPSQAEQLQQEIEKIIPNMQAVATEAKSWAVGGTGSRDGEDTDNAKYYAQQSEKSAQESAQGLENISQQVEATKGYAESAKTESLHAANHAQNAAESERNALESAKSAKESESNAKEAEQLSAESAQQSEEARQAIENMTASAVSVGTGAEPYVKKTSSGGVVNLEFGLRDGEPGPPGYTVPADGLYAFHIDENGDLIITYAGDEVPPFSIDENGNLIYTLAGNEVNIGNVVGGGGTGGTMNYTDLINKPRINGVELVGDKTTAELGIKDGQTPNITTGTVETLPSGSNATASITGQTPNLVLNLGIPKGQQGDPGQAATVTVGTTTTGAPGSQASVINSGTLNAAVLDFTIPAGETGDGLPPTDTAHVGDVPTWDGQQVVWGAPSGGGGSSAPIPPLVNTVDYKEDTTVVELEILHDMSPYRRIFMLAKIQADSQNVTMTYFRLVNNSNQNLTNYKLWMTAKTAQRWTWAELLKTEKAIFSILPDTKDGVPAYYSYTPVSAVSFGVDVSRWAGSLILTTNDDTWNFANGTKIYVFAD